MKILECKRCKIEEVEVPDNRVSAVCESCIEKETLQRSIEARKQQIERLQRTMERLKQSPAVAQRWADPNSQHVMGLVDKMLQTATVAELEDAERFLASQEAKLARMGAR